MRRRTDHIVGETTEIIEPNGSDQSKVESWRLHVLMEAGYPLSLAERLAGSEADLHRAVELVGQGCAPETAVARGKPGRLDPREDRCRRGDPEHDKCIAPAGAQQPSTSEAKHSCHWQIGYDGVQMTKSRPEETGVRPILVSCRDTTCRRRRRSRLRSSSGS